MKFNKPNTVDNEISSKPNLALNHEGGVAFTMEPLTELYTIVASCLMGENKFYESAQEGDSRLREAIQRAAQVDPKFTLQLAAYAREDLHLRSVPLALLVEASLTKECKQYVKDFTQHVIQRADELTEAIAYLQSRIGNIGNQSPTGSMPCSLKRGLADAFHSFNAYQFAKYDRDGKVKLRDVMRLVHPKPRNDEESKLFKQIIQRTLPTPDTWESYISANGSTKETWTHIAPKMRYMALLRNLRNFLEKGVEMDTILKTITDPHQVMRSRQFPFRFLSAYRELQSVASPDASRTLDSLESALDTSVNNLPKLPGYTLIAADNSGSMGEKLSEKSSVKYVDVANMMLAIANRVCEKPLTVIFGETLAVKNFSQRSTLANMESIKDDEVGASTNTYLVCDYLLKHKIKVDRIIIFSDEQGYDSMDYGNSLQKSFLEYQRTVNPDVYLYSCDLAGYGTTQVDLNNPHVVKVAGWSDRILQYIGLYEGDRRSIVEEIRQIDPSTRMRGIASDGGSDEAA